MMSKALREYLKTEKHLMVNPAFECSCGFRTDFYALFMKHMEEKTGRSACKTCDEYLKIRKQAWEEYEKTERLLREKNITWII